MPVWESQAARELIAKLIKSLRPEAADVILIERLVERGLLTSDDLARYVEKVEKTDYWGLLFNILSPDLAASIINGIDVRRVVQMLNSNKLRPDVVTRIFSSDRMSSARAIEIVDTWTRDVLLTNIDNLAAAIEGTRVDVNDVAQLWSTYLSRQIVSADRLASVLNSSHLSTAKAASVLSSPNMTAEHAARIIMSSSLDVARAEKIVRNVVDARAQEMLYAWVDSLRSLDRLVDLMTLSAPSLRLYADIVLSGISWLRDLDLSGFKYVADGQPHVIIAYSISIPSTSSIIKTPTGGTGGRPGADGAGRGGIGGGGLIIIARSLVNYGTISADGERGADGSKTSAHGGGGDGGGGYMVRVVVDSPGIGGSGGYGGVGGAPGAGGGGGGYTYRGGSGGSITLKDYVSNADLLKDVLKAACDWWLIKIGKMLRSYRPFPSCFGAGGGGGGSYAGYAASGGGGGSGGWIFIFAHNLDNRGMISARGGDGGRGGEYYRYFGGGGGGGGLIYVFYNNMISRGYFDVSGGRGGEANGVSGTAGTAKIVPVWLV